MADEYADYMAVRAARRATMDGEGDQADLLQRLKTATPAQLDTWIETNITTLAAARVLLKAIVKYLARNA